MTMWRLRIACWMPLATNTYSEYVILIAFPQQQWLQERASILRYAHIFCVANLKRGITCTNLWDLKTLYCTLIILTVFTAVC